MIESFKIPSATYPTLTGSIVTFNSQYALPLKSCVVDIPFIQEGTGDPSPDNVRNFVGVDSLDFSATGKNLLRPNTGSGTYNGVTFTYNEDFSVTTSGEYQGTNIPYIYSYLVTLRAGTYILTGCPSGGSYSDYVVRIENSSAQRIALDTGNGKTFTLTEDTPVFCRIYIYSQNGVGKTFYPMVRLVDSGSDYEPFGNNKVFTFGQTIYSGQLDVLHGVVKPVYEGSEVSKPLYFGITLDSNNVSSSEANVSYNEELDIYRWNQIIFPSTIVGPSFLTKCNKLKYSNDAYNGTSSGKFFDLGSGRLYVSMAGSVVGGSKAGMIQWLRESGITFVYQTTATPEIYVGGMDISLLQNENNLFASAGDTTLQYPKFG